MDQRRIAVVGGGNMAGAIISGCLDSGALGPEAWIVAEPDQTKRGELQSRGIRTVPSAGALLECLGGSDQILLAVKPQVFPEIASEFGGAAGDRVVISILAGIPSERIRESLGTAVRVVRVMPNTPARIGQGATAIAMGAGAREGDDELALRVFGSVGPVVERMDEALIDAFTAVAGSGPAYVFYLAEAMTLAAIDLGFSAEVAERIVRQTIIGASGLLGASGEPAPALRAAVTSKGGTTAAAIEQFDRAQVMTSVVTALRAARDRGRELGETR